jgi:hypothetical protein
VATRDFQGKGAYAGLQGGYHDIDGGADGGIFGGYIGYNFNTGSRFVVGVEANANIGTGDIDAEYGASVHIGGKFSDNRLLFVRGDYQEVDFENFGSDGDYLLGVDADFGVGENTSLRIVLDTIAFDSTRATDGSRSASRSRPQRIEGLAARAERPFMRMRPPSCTTAVPLRCPRLASSRDVAGACRRFQRQCGADCLAGRTAAGKEAAATAAATSRRQIVSPPSPPLPTAQPLR